MSSFSVVPVGWEIKEIKDAGISVIDGDRGKQYPKKSEFTSAGFCLFLNTGNIKGDSFDFSNCDFITEQKDSLLKKGKLRRRDIVLTTRGTVGSVAYYSESVSFEDVRINSGMVIMRAGENLDSCYLYYLLKSPISKTQYSLYASGSAQPQLPIKDLRRIKLPLPPIEIQRKIAAILTAYDDLIEVNKRRIALLERMAEELYREWFLRLRFPGYQDTHFVKGVPEGWKHSPIGDLTSVLSRGISPTYSDESARLVINQKCIRDGNIEWSHSKTHTTVIPEKKVLKDMDTLVNSTGVGTLGRSAIVWKAGEDLTCDSHVTICRADITKVAPLFLGYAVGLLCPYFEYLAIGATGQTELNQSFISKTRILVPTRDVQQRFQEECFPLLDLVHNLRITIANLTQTRDLLLPRLISGKLSVEDLDIQFPPSMQESTADQESLPEARHA